MKTVIVTERDLSSGLGRRQRQVLRDIADRGKWSYEPGSARQPGDALVETVYETRKICAALVKRGFLALYEHGPDSYILTPAGYAWLLTDIALDMAQCSADSKGYKGAISRAAQLIACARLIEDGPVNWKGESV